MTTDRTYDDLADAAERGDMRVVRGTERVGQDAMRDARDALLASTGASSIEEAARLALGRPRVGESRAQTITWRVRVSPEQEALVEQAIVVVGTSRSQYIRTAVMEKVARDAQQAS